MSDRRGAEHIRTISFLDAVEQRYGRYARRVLGFRHFPEGRDGLLPVQRRALWSMRGLGATSRGHATKTAKASGYTTGNLHPHGDSSVSTSIANMTQFKMAVPLVVGIGNFGWHDAPPSAPRYTSCHLSEYALTMMDPSELTVVPMDQTYDGKGTEPRYLPARLPHLLVAGCFSMAPGFSGRVPPCPHDWVLEAVERTVRRERVEPPCQLAYRWGGTLVDLEDGWLESGVARARFRPTLSVDGRRLLVTSLAPQLDAAAIIARMEGCAELGSASEETPEGDERVRIVCTLRRGGDLRALRDHARRELRGRDGYSFLHIRQFDSVDGVDYEPVVEGPLAYLRRWVRWRTGIVVGAATHRAATHRADAARLEVLLRAIAARRQLLAALEAARDKADLTVRVGKILQCSTEEATHVVELQFYRLATMNVPGIRERIVEHRAAAAREDRVVARPVPRLLADAEATHGAMERVSRIGVKRPRERKRRKS